MGFWKEKGKSLFYVFSSFFILLQGIALRYGRNYRAQTEITRQWNQVWDEIDELAKLWRQADVKNFVTFENMANQKELEQALARLKQATMSLKESEKRVQEVKGSAQQFYQKAHAYYQHAASRLTALINFLRAKKGKYSFKDDDMVFESERDMAVFRELIKQISYLDQEKKDLDALIKNHNRKHLLLMPKNKTSEMEKKNHENL